MFLRNNLICSRLDGVKFKKTNSPNFVLLRAHCTEIKSCSLRHIQHVEMIIKVLFMILLAGYVKLVQKLLGLYPYPELRGDVRTSLILMVLRRKSCWIHSVTVPNCDRPVHDSYSTLN
jgi:hypothetical protein